MIGPRRTAGLRGLLRRRQGEVSSRPRPPDRSRAPIPFVTAAALLLAAPAWLPHPAGAQLGELEENLPYVEEILIEGNEAFGDGRIKDQMRTREPHFWEFFRRPRYRRDFLRRDMASIEAFYHRNGYLEARSEILRVETDPSGERVRITIGVEEGKQTLVGEVTFTGRPRLPEERLMKALSLRPGIPFNPSVLGAERYSLLTLFLDLGYLRAEVVDSVSVRDHRADIAYRIHPGRPYTIESITIEGNRSTRSRIVRRELEIEDGDLFQLEKIIDSKQNLFNTGLFRDVEIEPGEIDSEDRTVALEVRLQERKMAYAEAGIGFGNVVGNRLLGEVGHRNLFGTGRKLNAAFQLSYDLLPNDRFRWKEIENIFHRIDGEYREPHFLATRYDLTLQAYSEKDATIDPVVLETVGGGLRLNRRVGRHTQYRVGATQNRISLKEEDLPREEDTTRLLSLRVIYDSRDDVFDPAQGTYRTVDVDFAGGFLRGDNDFYSAVLSYSKYTRVGGGLVAAFRVRAGYAEPFSESTNVPFENRFFAGGSYSVRGYEENSLGPRRRSGVSEGPIVTEVDRGNAAGGETTLLAAAELRYPLPLLERWNFSGAFFLDSGNVWQDVNQISWADFRPWVEPDEVTVDDYRLAVGLGIRYRTPVGPIRVDFGIPVKRAEDFKKVGIVHFGLGQAF